MNGDVDEGQRADSLSAVHCTTLWIGRGDQRLRRGELDPPDMDRAPRGKERSREYKERVRQRKARRPQGMDRRA